MIFQARKLWQEPQDCNQTPFHPLIIVVRDSHMFRVSVLSIRVIKIVAVAVVVVSVAVKS